MKNLNKFKVQELEERLEMRKWGSSRHDACLGCSVCIPDGDALY